MILCDACKRGWQEGAGVRAPMAVADVERAKCDAQHLGAVDTARPARATQDVPPRVRRMIRRRDGGKCSLPGCRATTNLELHHIVAREDGGSHEATNIVQLCDGHHAALHRGMISITGEAPDRLVFARRHDPSAHVDARSAKLDRAAQRIQARRALVDLGFKMSEAAGAIDAAHAAIGVDVSLELLVREARRRCPKPKGS